jgi:stage V sporulation protein G
VEITEVRIKLVEEAGERLQAFCSITFDNCFVIRDLKIIDGSNGPFVAMPSRKLTSHCPQCRTKNHLRANHCNECGYRLSPNRAPQDDDGRAKLYADIAHPINSECREMIQERVIQEFHDELERSKLPGYKPSYDDFDIDELPPSRSGRPSRSHPTTSYGRPGDKRSQHSTPKPAPQRAPAANTARAASDGQAAGANRPTEEVPAASPPKQDGFGAGIL